MTTYNTGKPVGSADPRDLYDNAENLDTLVNSQEKLAHDDRLGVSRKTWHGMETEFDTAQAQRAADFQEFLLNSGYQVIDEAYGAGIEVTARNQVILSNGEYWKLAASADLPYTTTGLGMPEDGAFVGAGDNVLRQELANQSGAGFGTDLVGHNGGTARGAINQRTMYAESVADIESLSLNAGVSVYLTQPGVSGPFVVKSGAHASDPQKGVFIDLANGNYAERQYGQNVMVKPAVNVLWFGATGDGITDDLAAIQAAVNFPGGTYLPGVPGSAYRVSGPVSVAAAQDIYGAGFDSKIGYDGTRSRALNIQSPNVHLHKLRIESLDLGALNSVDECLIHIAADLEDVSVTWCCLGNFEQQVGDGYGYAILAEGQGIRNLKIDDNLFTRARANDDDTEGGDGFCGFIYIYHRSAASFTTGVNGSISNNNFYDTETIPANTLRSDADAIRFYNAWVWETDFYATPDKVNSYDIEIAGNNFGLIQHLCIKASGVGGLNVHHNIINNTQADRYPSTPNSFGTNGEKDWQTIFEFRGGDFICEGNRGKSQGGGIAATGVLGIEGYSGEINGNIVSLMPDSRDNVAAISLRQDNVTARGNTLDAPSNQYTRLLSAAFAPTYFTGATKMVGVSLDNNTVKNGGAYIVDLWDSEVIDLKLRNGPLTTRRDNNVEYRGLRVVNDEKPFIPELSGGNPAENNRFIDCHFRARNMTAGSGDRAIQIPGNMANTLIDELTIEVDETTGTGSGCYPFDGNASGMKVRGLTVKYKGANDAYWSAYSRYFNDAQVGRVEVIVNDTAGNNAVPFAETNASGDSIVIESAIARTVTGDMSNSGIGTTIINLIGNFSVVNSGSGTHTVHNSTGI
jgi:hypothetical protein